MWKRKDFFPSGSGETAPIFIVIPIIYAGKAVKDRTLSIINDGVCYNFVGKEGLINAKKHWLKKRNSSSVQKEFEEWCAKWHKYDKDFFQLATNKIQDWKKAWKKLDSFQKRLWFEAYKIETLDNFADEIDREIVSELTRIKIPAEYKFNLLSPGEPNHFQRMLADRNKVKKSQMTERDYIRKYWFSHGNWNGGLLLDKKNLKGDLNEKVKSLDFPRIKNIHSKYDKLLSKKIRTPVEIIRILSLWREERKAVLQKITLGYVNISNLVAKKLGVNPNLVRSSLLNEVKNLKINPEIFRNRIEASVYLVEKNKSGVKILAGKKAEPYLKEFLDEVKDKVIKGTIASQGKVFGRARIILKKKDFTKLKKGEVLVTTMTRPEYFPILKKAAAIVTDEGGLTSHAAIISRELGVPCVIGTKIATQALKSGDRVEVDANKGIVKIISKA
jgi:phosphohistidine swiveling domain-containing protein